MPELGYITCARCEAEVQLPANFCDMCGNSLAAESPPTHEGPTHSAQNGFPSNGHGETPASLLSEAADRHRDEAGLSDAHDRLRRAYSLLEEVDKELEGFRSNMLETVQSIDYSLRQGEVGESLLEDVMSDPTLPRQRQTIREHLDSALKEIEMVRREEGSAVLEIDGKKADVQTLTARLDRARGDLALSAGRLRDAIKRYQRSAIESEFADTFFALGLVYECANQPGRAVQAFDRCGKLAPTADVAIEARKSVGRLKSKMVLGGWFVGSWKVFLIPVGLTTVGLIGSLFDARLIPAAAVCTIFAGVYWRSRFRK